MGHELTVFIYNGGAEWTMTVLLSLKSLPLGIFRSDKLLTGKIVVASIITFFKIYDSNEMSNSVIRNAMADTET